MLSVLNTCGGKNTYFILPPIPPCSGHAKHLRRKRILILFYHPYHHAVDMLFNTCVRKKYRFYFTTHTTMQWTCCLIPVKKYRFYFTTHTTRGHAVRLKHLRGGGIIHVFCLPPIPSIDMLTILNTCGGEKYLLLYFTTHTTSGLTPEAGRNTNFILPPIPPVEPAADGTFYFTTHTTRGHAVHLKHMRQEEIFYHFTTHTSSRHAVLP